MGNLDVRPLAVATTVLMCAAGVVTTARVDLDPFVHAQEQLGGRERFARLKTLEVRGRLVWQRFPGRVGAMAFRLGPPDKMAVVETRPGTPDKTYVASLLNGNFESRVGTRDLPGTEDVRRRFEWRLNRAVAAFFLRLPDGCRDVGENFRSPASQVVVAEKCGGFTVKFDAGGAGVSSIQYDVVVVAGGAARGLGPSESQGAEFRGRRRTAIERYDDYRMVGGLQLPFGVVLGPGVVRTFAVTEIKVNPQWTDDAFTVDGVQELQKWAELVVH